MSSDHSDAPILVQRDGSVLLVTYNRPERLNAWTERLAERYFAVLHDADNDPTVRSIVVTGAGRGFCAGADFDELTTIVDGARPTDNEPREVFPWTISKPLIAAINGPAAGMGLLQALLCDVRFCVPEAKLTTSFAHRGLNAEWGMAWLLPRLVGLGRALDLLLSARIVRGDEALGIGLVDRIVEPPELLEAAMQYARDLGENCSPAAMAQIKAEVRRALDVDFDTAVRESVDAMLQATRRPDFREGVNSFIEGRPPKFPGLGPRRGRG